MILYLLFSLSALISHVNILLPSLWARNGLLLYVSRKPCLKKSCCKCRPLWNYSHAYNLLEVFQWNFFGWRQVINQKCNISQKLYEADKVVKKHTRVSESADSERFHPKADCSCPFACLADRLPSWLLGTWAWRLPALHQLI